MIIRAINEKYKNVEIDVKGRKGEHYGAALAFWSPSDESK
ncbi:hypothetical protein PT2222_20406 [Paraburkholderia tropica]